eukprot:6260518-Prymnesium_polylepis.1
MFITPGSVMQLVVGCLLVLAFLLLQTRHSPFKLTSLDILSFVSHCSIFLMGLFAMADMAGMTDKDESSGGQSMDAILLTVFLVPIGTFSVLVLHVLCSYYAVMRAKRKGVPPNVLNAMVQRAMLEPIGARIDSRECGCSKSVSASQGSNVLREHQCAEHSCACTSGAVGLYSKSNDQMRCSSSTTAAPQLIAHHVVEGITAPSVHRQHEVRQQQAQCEHGLPAEPQLQSHQQVVEAGPPQDS